MLLLCDIELQSIGLKTRHRERAHRLTLAKPGGTEDASGPPKHDLDLLGISQPPTAVDDDGAW